MRSAAPRPQSEVEVTKRVQASLPSIQRSLQDLFEQMQKSDDEQMLQRAAAANLVVLVSSAARLAAYTEVVATLCRVHPCRLFLFYFDESLSEPRVETIAQCHRVAGGSAVCTESIVIGAARAHIPRLPSVLRANLVASVPTEVVLSGFDVPQEMLDLVLPIADRVLFSSETFMRRFSALAQLRERALQMIDLQWVAVSPWRGLVKALFDLRAGREVLYSLGEVRIRGQHRTGLPLSAVQLLMAGFVADRLGLHLDEQAEARGLVVLTHSPHFEKPILVRFEDGGESGDENPVLQAVEFVSRDTRSPTQRVSVIRDGPARALESRIDPGPQFRSLSPIEGESVDELIERYFMVGESITNYPAALAMAMRMATCLGMP